MNATPPSGKTNELKANLSELLTSRTAIASLNRGQKSGGCVINSFSFVGRHLSDLDGF